MTKTVFIVLFNFITGTLCLVYGVRFLSGGLERCNRRFMEKLLAACTGSLFRAFLTGTALTALVQSSTAVTIITVGLVDSGLMSLTQAVGIIYGANIGTTVTAQLMSLKITTMALPITVLGILIYISSKKQAARNVATVIIGLGLLFTGINILGFSIPYIKDSKFVYRIIMNYGNNPYIALIIGMVTTMLIQSSSATVAATIVLFNSGLLSLDAAIALTLGDNVGTCMTAQLASIGMSVSARRTAWAHTLYNLIGVLLAMLFLEDFSKLIKGITSLIGQDESKLVANTHTVFNTLSAAVFLPFTGYYVKFLKWIVPDIQSQKTRRMLH